MGSDPRAVPPALLTGKVTPAGKTYTAGLLIDMPVREATVEDLRFDLAVRYRQWQAALRRVLVMRRELVRLGVTDPAVLGEPLFEIGPDPPAPHAGTDPA